jgi:hypothetical protein
MIKSQFGVLSYAFFLFAGVVFAQENSAGSAEDPGCGEAKIKFAVETEKEKHSPQPDGAKALVYFIEDDSNFGSTPKPTTRIGIDGRWVGATENPTFTHPLIPESTIFARAGSL